MNQKVTSNFLKANFLAKKLIKMRQSYVKNTVKAVLSGHSKIDKTTVLKTNGSLKKVESIEECSKRAFCNSFDLH